MHPDYDSILPINGWVFNTSCGTWTAEVSKWPIPTQTRTDLLYEVKFKGPSVRQLKLWVPGEIDAERRQQEVFGDVKRWLEEQNGGGELRSCFS